MRSCTCGEISASLGSMLSTCMQTRNADFERATDVGKAEGEGIACVAPAFCIMSSVCIGHFSLLFTRHLPVSSA